jgi:WhiB family redox-sensing transcriptional regulator
VTVSAPAERPRILAELAGRPGQTAYEVAAALGYGKPASRRVASIIKRMHQDGVLVAVTELRATTGRPGRIYYLAPPGTPPQTSRETLEQAERRRARDRAAAARRRARAAGKTTPKPGDDRRLAVLRPAAASLGTASGQPACRDASPALFFGPQDEAPEAQAARLAEAKTYCIACPIRVACLETAQANRERAGVWGGIDFETERDQRSTQATRPDVAASGRA